MPKYSAPKPCCKCSLEATVGKGKFPPTTVKGPLPYSKVAIVPKVPPSGFKDMDNDPISDL